MAWAEPAWIKVLTIISCVLCTEGFAGFHKQGRTSLSRISLVSSRSSCQPQELPVPASTGSNNEGNAVVSPSQIMRPNFPIEGTGKVPLGFAIQDIQKALQYLLDHETDTTTSATNNHVGKVHINGDRLLRIEQPLSNENIDPLRWLRAQYDDGLVSPVVYFADAEGFTDIAGIGSMHTLTGESALDEHEWEILESLPSSFRYYGGGRFDPAYPIEERSAEWESHFGGHYFILPTIELRKDSSAQHISTATGGQGNRSNPVSMNDHVRVNDAHIMQQKKTFKTTLSVNLRYGPGAMHLTLADAIKTALKELVYCFNDFAPAVAPTLPPIINRLENESQESWEIGVNTALDLMGCGVECGIDENIRPIKPVSMIFEKVVLARTADLFIGDEFHPLDTLLRYKLSGYIGHFLFLRPDADRGRVHETPVFLGCTPERLFRVNEYSVMSEALAGTRPRGSDPKADAELLADLMSSPKDMAENEITANYILDVFDSLQSSGLLDRDSIGSSSTKSNRFVRRLKHLQHICQQFSAKMNAGATVTSVARQLMIKLHPTPAMCGLPVNDALNFIQKYESFDRGFYAGPFGYISNRASDMVVSIRSGLLTQCRPSNMRSSVKLSIFAGAGIVPGSTAKDEWTETAHKLSVLTSLFPSSPLTLRGLPNVNYVWATAIVEELIRSGITDFMICPGSRSTPLTACIAKAARKNIGAIRVVSVHDERGAAFRAIGSARATGRPAVVVTSSGTAVANLYPAVMEASNDGIPLVLLTADRPYEARGTGANQAVDQVKAFGDRVRWFRDIAAPTADIPISVGLSDVNHAVTLAESLMGPVHLNAQFRENLAPDGGVPRGDDRGNFEETFSLDRFTDAAGFHRWAYGSVPWQTSYANSPMSSMVDVRAVREVSQLLEKSKRGIIVVGNIRGFDDDTVETIVHVAETLGFPIFADVQSGALRGHSAIIPYADHVLKCQSIARNLNPDFILQIGHPLISTEVQKVIQGAMKRDSSLSSLDDEVKHPRPSHVLIHPHYTYERADPAFTVTHRVSCQAATFLKSVSEQLKKEGTQKVHSQLSPLVEVGRFLREKMPQFIHQASANVCEQKGLITQGQDCPLTEPQVTLAVAEAFEEAGHASTLFLSNSMPVRDAEAFMYPRCNDGVCLKRVSVNRGASGIDGIISTAAGFASSNQSPTTLLIGDVAALHDINGLHTLNVDSFPSSSAPLSTVVVNNNGGGIFSFLPISKHGDDVGFEEYFGTPTDSFSFSSAAKASGIPFSSASTYKGFKREYKDVLEAGKHTLVEAKVVDRETNVAVHAEITKLANTAVEEFLTHESGEADNSLEMIEYSNNVDNHPVKTILLLHGWLGTKEDWKESATELTNILPDWRVIAVDLPGHGNSSMIKSSRSQAVRNALDIQATENATSVDEIAKYVSAYLRNIGIHHVDVVCGYSLGGRVSLAMRRLALQDQLEGKNKSILMPDTKMVLLGSNPGVFFPSEQRDTKTIFNGDDRAVKDDNLAIMMKNSFERSMLVSDGTGDAWAPFLEEWYAAPLWGNLQSNNPSAYREMISRRIAQLVQRGGDLAAILQSCSPGRNSMVDWKYASSLQTMFVAGSLDEKYVAAGKNWEAIAGIRYHEINNVGHALLTEASSDVAKVISNFVLAASNYSQMIEQDPKQAKSQDIPLIELFPLSSSSKIDLPILVVPTQFEFEKFSLDLGNPRSTSDTAGLFGLGWGKESHNTKDELKTREGIIISLSTGEKLVGVGEVSPLAGLHEETLDEALAQVVDIRSVMTENTELVPALDPSKILSLNGLLSQYINDLVDGCGIEADSLYPSVRAGLESAVISLASQAISMVTPQALAAASSEQIEGGMSNSLVLNGLETRSPQSLRVKSEKATIAFTSLKVKIGHRSVEDDANILSNRSSSGKVRGDANRSWTMSQALSFSESLSSYVEFERANVEFIEEPLIQYDNLESQIGALKEFYDKTGLNYALDESIAELVAEENNDFLAIEKRLRNILKDNSGCAAFVLKPALLGSEMSTMLARLSNDLGIGAVYSSSFDSGVGLAHAAFLASISDAHARTRNSPVYAHGLGTFTTLRFDTISPPFSSFVDSSGIVDMEKLSRSIYGLSLDETTEMKSSGKKITVTSSINLPFSCDVACARFTDWPQQPRWSPWLSSVAYVPGSSETEWTLNVRGARLQWRAISAVSENPPKVMWESVSGLKNRGTVKFVPLSSTSCTMTATVTFVTPRPISMLFKDNEFLKEFLRNKLMSWSLEMFRDVVKADLALERGDAELGDALFGAVEGRASAIEATLLLSSGNSENDESDWQ